MSDDRKEKRKDEVLRSDGEPMSQGEINTAPHKWEKGKSGNLKGRPKGTSLTGRLKKILDEEVDGKTVAEKLVQAGVDAAIDGDFRFWSFIIERLEGKAVEKIETDNTNRIIIIKDIDRLSNDSEQDNNDSE